MSSLHIARLSICLLASAIGLADAGREGDIDRMGSERTLSKSVSHVTRLHRYDHSGDLRSMLEREAEWHRTAQATQQEVSVDAVSTVRQGSTSFRSLGARRGTTVLGMAERYFRLPHSQVRQLREHQGVFIQAMSTASTLKTTGSQPEATATMGAQLQTAQKHQQTSGSQERFAPAAKVGKAVTGLSNLQSQYVGPIGVGTMRAPEGCSTAPRSLLQFVNEGDSGSNEKAKDVSCRAETESQVFVVFDTGSTNIWVSSDLCIKGPCTKKGRTRYNHTRSSTYQVPKDPLQLSIEFGTGKIEGPHGVDDFHIGPFSVYNQTFGLIETQSGSVFEDVPFEGILGLAFSKMSANNVQPFFDRVVEQKALNKNEFSFYFSQDNPAANAVFWGEHDSNFYKGDLNYFPVIEPYYWSLELNKFRIGDDVLMGEGMSESTKRLLNHSDSLFQKSEGGGSLLDVGGKEKLKVKVATKRSQAKAVVDTGTTYFTAHGELFKEVMRRLPSQACDSITEQSHPDIGYTLRKANGKLHEFKFTNKQYMTTSDNGSGARCSPAFMNIGIPAKHGPAMVLGEVFLRNYYAVFDRGDGDDANARVAFAPSVHSAKTEDLLRDLTKSQPKFQDRRGDNA